MFSPAFPMHVVFVLSDTCNLACIHCSSSAGVGAKNSFSTECAKGVLDDLAEVGVLDVALSGGEPLLRKDLPELVRHARRLGMTVGTSTNGYPLTPLLARELKAAGLCRLQVSVDGTEATHDVIRGAGSFRKACDAIRTSVSAGLRTHICFTAMKGNAETFSDVVEMAVALGVQGINLSQFVPTGRGTKGHDLGGKSARDLLVNWLRIRDCYPHLYFSTHWAGMPDVSGDACRSSGCEAGRAIGCITATGDVTPCVMFPFPLGNVHVRRFRDIWANATLLEDLRTRNVKGACAGCSHREACGGCRGAAWAWTGDPLAEDPRCWYCTAAVSQDTNTATGEVKCLQ